VWSIQRKDQTQLRVVCPGKVTALSVSPDGIYCVAAVAEKIHIWQVSTGNLLAVLSKHYLTVRCLRFTDDGSHFVSGADDNSVFVWPLSRVLASHSNSSRVEPRHSWNDHVLPITDIHVGCGGCRARVATASRDKTVKLWDMASGLLLCTLTFSAEVTAVTMDAADYRLFTGTSSAIIYQINLFDDSVTKSQVTSGEQLALTGHSGAITCLSLSLDGATLASGSHDSTVRLWSTSSRQCIRTLLHTDGVTNVMFSPMPPAILDVDAPRPSLPFCQFKRHLVCDGDTADRQADCQNIVNVRLCGQQTTQTTNQVETCLSAVQFTQCLQSTSTATDDQLKLSDELQTTKRKNKELYLFAVNKILKV
jgi:pre-rRNA-processing protein IPI3